jgi:hypothetical protein
MKMIRTLLILVAFAAGASPLQAALSPQQARQAAAEIDALLTDHWTKAGVPASPTASDAVFLRRVYLDLAGRIPTPVEASAFLESRQADKRALLIADLLSREGYVSNFYNFWADILRHKSYFVNTANIVPAAYGKYIKQSLRENKPYDQFVFELLSARGHAWDTGAIGYYLRDPEMPLDNMALTSRVFLGTRIECAQCHNHPFDKWKQTEFYRLAAYTYGNKPLNETLSGVRDAFREREQVILDDFKKEKAASNDGGAAAERRKNERMQAIELRKVLNIIRHGVGQLFSPMGLDRRADIVLKLPHDFQEPDGKPGDVIRPMPIFGVAPELRPGDDAATVFARWMTSPENPRFTRVIVNRLWKKMFGVALVEPLDDLRDDTQAMIPAVESHLQRLMITLKYDQRDFLAVIANTRAYQSAVSTREFAAGDTYHFTGPILRRMTAEQAWDSLVTLVSHTPDARDLRREARDQRRIDVSHMAADAYLGYDGRKLVDLGYARLSAEKELEKQEKAVREELVEAKRTGDKDRDVRLRRALGAIERSRNESYVREFLTPLLTSLANRIGPNAVVSEDETYTMNTNPAVLAVETWRKTHVTGYGPKPLTAAEAKAQAAAELNALRSFGAQLGYAEKDLPGFVAHCQRVSGEWLRASELDSPAPRGHFLRTMGQSDRDFVENANPNASIPQALSLMNSDLISQKGVLSPFSPLMRHVTPTRTADATAGAVYLAVLSRAPTEAELTTWRKASASGMQPADLIYALLNSKQFLFIQ